MPEGIVQYKACVPPVLAYIVVQLSGKNIREWRNIRREGVLFSPIEFAWGDQLLYELA